MNLRSIVEGIEFIWIQRIILSLFLLDFGVTLVGFYRPILPIFAADVFNMGASGLGLLYAAPSAGSLLGSAALLMAGDIKRKGVAVVMAAVGFAGSLALLGVSKWFCHGGGGGDPPRRYRFGERYHPSHGGSASCPQRNARTSESSLVVIFAQTTNGLGALLAGAVGAIHGRAELTPGRQWSLLSDDSCYLRRHSPTVALSFRLTEGERWFRVSGVRFQLWSSRFLTRRILRS